MAALCLAATLHGCASTQQTIVKAGEATVDFFAPIEGLPRRAKALEILSLDDLARADGGWREYELGRRYEFGIGLPRDVLCARYWYGHAAISPYEDVGSPTVWGFNPPTVTYVGVPWARIGLRRLSRERMEPQPGRSVEPLSMQCAPTSAWL